MTPRINMKCRVLECEKRAHARGLCLAHYQVDYRERLKIKAGIMPRKPKEKKS